jgi:hypothetical protein
MVGEWGSWVVVHELERQKELRVWQATLNVPPGTDYHSI